MEMLIGLVVVGAVALVAVAALVAVRAHARAERYGVALHRFDAQLGPISQSIRQSVERTSAAREQGARHELEPNLEGLLERIAEGGSAVVAFQELAEEMVPDIATSRRGDARSKRSEYEAELEREVARARRTGRPLSLVVVAVDDPTADRLLQLAALLSRVTRVTDTVCRRRRDAFGILLPETPEDGARRFYSRVHEEVAMTFNRGGQTTFSTGIVEWRPNETGESLDARARAAVEGRAAAGGGGDDFGDRALDERS